MGARHLGNSFEFRVTTKEDDDLQVSAPGLAAAMSAPRPSAAWSKRWVTEASIRVTVEA